MIDLHLHSTASDGSFRPGELTRLAADAGLTAIALTDHDTVSGVPEALAQGPAAGIEVIPGVEMSCVWEGTEIHILGYFLDPGSPEFLEDLSWFRKMRDERNETILDNLAEDGILLTAEELRNGDPDTVITRAHFARLLIEKGYVRDRKEAFSGYLSYGGKYVPTKDELTPERVMDMFRRHRIWPSLAHPLQYRFSDEDLQQLILELKEMGLRGLEVWHSSHTWQGIAAMQTLARISGLIPTGGSDFHGASKPDIAIGTGRGNLRIFERVLDAVKSDYASMQ